MSDIKIVRKRFVIIRDGDSIFSGLSGHYNFTKLLEIKGTPIKTYCTYNKAKASFINSWDNAEEELEKGRIKI